MIGTLTLDRRVVTFDGVSRDLGEWSQFQRLKYLTTYLFYYATDWYP